jgi:hypothetical protein
VTYTTRFGAAHLAALLLLMFSVYTPSVAAQSACTDLSADAQAVMCTVPSGSEYLDCIHHRDAVVAVMRKNIDSQTPPEVIATIDAAAAYDCVSDTSAAGSSQPPVPDPVVVAPTTASMDPPAASPPDPTDGFDITACLSTDAINTLLGRPTTYHERGGPSGADFNGPGGATLSMDHYGSQATTGFTDMLEGFKRPGSQIVPIDGLGDQAFAVNRGSGGRSLVVLQGDQLWLVSMDGVPPERGFPQMADLTRGMLEACP